MKMPDGSFREVQSPPITHDPKFFLALTKHVVSLDNARKIMNYIMQTHNELMDHTDQAVRGSHLHCTAALFAT